MTRRLVVHFNPEARETPLLLLASLREIDAGAELVYVGDRQWWLGCVTPNEPRASSGLRIEAQLKALSVADQQRPSIIRNFMLAKLLQQGFARIEAYHDLGDVSGEVLCRYGQPDEYRCTIVEDFRERDFHFKQDRGASVMQGKLDDMMGVGREDEARAEFNQYLQTDGRAQYRREMRGKVTFGHGGMSGGTGSGLIIPGR